MVIFDDSTFDSVNYLLEIIYSDNQNIYQILDSSDELDLQKFYSFSFPQLLENKLENKYALNQTIVNKRIQLFNVLIPIVIIKVSDTLHEESGQIAENLLKSRQNFNVVERVTITNVEFEKTLQNYITQTNIRCIITIGGTGISRTDNVIEIAKKYIEKELSGFGELFRYLTYQEMGKNKNDPGIGIPSVDTRTTAGTMGTTLLFCLPGTPEAVNLAILEIINPSIHTLIGQIDKGD